MGCSKSLKFDYLTYAVAAPNVYIAVFGDSRAITSANAKLSDIPITEFCRLGNDLEFTILRIDI